MTTVITKCNVGLSAYHRQPNNTYLYDEKCLQIMAVTASPLFSSVSSMHF